MNPITFLTKEQKRARAQLARALSSVHNKDVDPKKPAHLPWETLGMYLCGFIPLDAREIVVFSDCALLTAVLYDKKQRGWSAKVRFVYNTPEELDFAKKRGLQNFKNNPDGTESWDNELIDASYNDLEDNLKVIMKKFSQKFDVVLMNPPYRCDADKSFYKKFIVAGFELLKDGGVMAAITPHTWIRNAQGKSSSLMKRLCEQASFKKIHVLEAQNVFDISLGPVSYFILRKGGVTEDLHTVMTYESDAVLHKKDDPLFKKIVVDWVDLECGKGSDTEGEGARRFTHEKTATHKHPVFLSSRADRQACWSNWVAPGSGQPKLIISYITEPGKSSQFSWFNISSGVGRYCNYVLCTALEAKNIQSFLDSKTCKYVDSKGRNGRYFFMKLPNFDFTQVWDDMKYWQSKNLTQDEIDLIECTVK